MSVIIGTLQYPVAILVRRDIKKMSKIYLAGKHSRDVIIGDLLEKFSRKVEVYPPGTCPLTVQLSLLDRKSTRLNSSH